VQAADIGGEIVLLQIALRRRRVPDLVTAAGRAAGSPAARWYPAHAWLEGNAAVHVEEGDPTLVYHPIASYPLTDQRRPPR